MINGNILICPECQTEEHLYASPGRHHVRVECDKEEGGCGRQFVIPNDGGVKLADNILQQQLSSVPDNFFAGFVGYQAKGSGESLTWTLVGIVSELKKKDLEDHLKNKIEILSKLDITQQVKYELREYGVGVVTSSQQFIAPQQQQPSCNDECGNGKHFQSFDEMAEVNAMSKEEVEDCIAENKRLLEHPEEIERTYSPSDLTDKLRFTIRDGLNLDEEGEDPNSFDVFITTIDPNHEQANGIGSHIECVDKALRPLKIYCELMENIFQGKREDFKSNKVIIRYLVDEGWTYDPDLLKDEGWGDKSLDDANAFIEAGVFKIKGSLSKQTISSTASSVKEHMQLNL